MGANKTLKEHILEFEGGYVNDPSDNGGCTNSGVTLSTFKKVLNKPNATCNDLKKMTRSQWEAIVEYFWKNINADKIKNESIANLLVDWHWGSGSWGVKYANEVLCKESEFKLTQNSIDIINKYPNKKVLFNKFWKKRKWHFIALSKKPGQAKYLKGWLRRLDNLKYYDGKK